jgi:ATP-dependent helicase YprA (DUF1998 family)
VPNRELQQPDGLDIQAIVVYPMYALASSQDEERNGAYVLLPMTPGGAT